jgi:nitrite reductase (NADH) small subunit
MAWVGVRENGVGKWVRLCGVAEAPGTDEVREAEAVGSDGKGVPICLANVGGALSAIGNVCPHRQGPLGGGWIEEGKVLCPWHAWAFDVTTGEAMAPETGRVEVYPVKVEGGEVLVQIELGSEESEVEG